MTETEPTKLLRIGLGLLKRNAEQETAWVRALPAALKHFDGLLLGMPSLWEAPDAVDHPLVRSVADVCRAHAIDLYIGRRLFVTWNVYATRRQHRDDWYDEGYYAAVLTKIHGDARRLGAAGTHIQCEPHGDKLHTEWFLRQGFEEDQREKVEEAILGALWLAAPVDFVYPAGGGFRKSYSWAMLGLGKNRLNSQTYYAQSPGDVKIVPPPGYPDGVQTWGVLLGGDGLTVEQYLSLNWPAIQKAYPGCKGIWVMPDPVYRLAILREFAKFPR